MKTNQNFLPMSEDEKKNNFPKETVIKVIVGVITFVVFIFLVVIFGYLEIFNWLSMKVRLATGLDMFLVKSITFLLMALFFGTPLGGFAWSFLPIPMKKRRLKRFSFLAILSIIFLVVFFSSRNVYFDPSSGEPVQYYSIDMNGKYKFSSSGGFDPITGEELKPVTKEVIKRAESNIIDGENITVYGISGLTPEIKNKLKNQTKVEIKPQSKIMPREVIKTKVETKPINVVKTEPKIPSGEYILSITRNAGYEGRLNEVFNKNIRNVKVKNQTCELIIANYSNSKFRLIDPVSGEKIEIPTQGITRQVVHSNFYYIECANFGSVISILIPAVNSFHLHFANKMNGQGDDNIVFSPKK